MKKVIIIDDEILASGIITEFLKSHSDLEIVATCSNGFEGIKSIQTFLPDLIFLDIQMPKINGFEMLELIDNPPPVIFTTAFDEFAIKAFEANAIDYLLKPFSKERFDIAVNKWRINKNSENSKSIVSGLIQSVNSTREPTNRIVVKSGNNIRIIPLEEIHYVEAFDDYVKIHIKDDVFLKKQTMLQTEQLLDNKLFIRVHRSFIINLSEITGIEPYGKDSAIAKLKSGSIISLSKTGLSKLKDILGI